MCLVCSSAAQIRWIARLEGKKEFLVSESTNSDKNAFANSAGPDKNIHNEQSDQGQHRLPFYTDSISPFSCNPG